MKKIGILLFLLTSGTLKAEQVNALKFKSSFSSHSFLVEDGLDGYKGLGLEYRGIISLSYESAENLISVVDSVAQEKFFDVVERFSRVRLSGGYFITPSLFLGLTVPMDQIIGKQPYSPSGSNTGLEMSPFEKSSFILGDIGLKVKKRLFDLNDKWNLTLGGAVYLPTGDELWYNTDGLSFGADISFSRYLSDDHRLRSYGNLGYLYSSDSKLVINDKVEALDTKQRVVMGLGLSYDFTDNFAGFSELATHISMPFKDYQNPLAFNLGARYTVGRNIIFAGVGAESLFDSEHSENRFFGGVKFQFGSRSKLGVSKVQKRKREQAKVARAYSEGGVPPVVVTQGPGDDFQKSVGDLVRFSRSIEFQTGLSTIMPIYYSELDSIVSLFRKNQKYIKLVKIVGHTDSRGDSKDNANLSLKRANALKSYFVEKGGLPEKMFEVKGLGESSPLVQEVDEYSMKINRRVEFFVHKLKE